MVENKSKKDRISLRISRKDKERIDRAAEIMGQDRTSFMSSAALEKAMDIMEKESRISLSERDFKKMMETIENPPEPNEELEKAFDSHGNWIDE